MVGKRQVQDEIPSSLLFTLLRKPYF